jgi:RNA methyltransferase, TrmH family
MSISKAQIKRIRSYQQKKFRSEDGVFVIEGRKNVEEALRMHKDNMECFTTDSDFSERLKVPLIEQKDMEQISSLTTPPGYLAVLKQPQHRFPVEPKRVCIANDLSDPGNLGTLIRTAEWFGVEILLLDEEAADPFNAKTVQATMGSILRMPILRSSRAEIIQYCRNEKLDVLVADMQGENIYSFTAPASWALVIGSESHGVHTDFRKAAAHAVHIPSKGKAESLNATVAAGILLSHL